MKRSLAALAAFVFVFLIVPGRCGAGARTISWGVVTTYTDGTPIEPSAAICLGEGSLFVMPFLVGAMTELYRIPEGSAGLAMSFQMFVMM